jgi:hypothetical protein
MVPAMSKPSAGPLCLFGLKIQPFSLQAVFLGLTEEHCFIRINTVNL